MPPLEPTFLAYTDARTFLLAALAISPNAPEQKFRAKLERVVVTFVPWYTFRLSRP